MVEENTVSDIKKEDTKPGWKSTEFYASIGTAALGVGVLLGYVNQTEASDLIKAVSTISGSLISAISIAGYALSRGKAKANQTGQSVQPLDYNALLAVLGTFAQQSQIQSSPIETSDQNTIG